jgi:hypothetical protein
MIIVLFATLTFMMKICSALNTIIGGGVLNSVQYSIFELKISVTRGTYSHVYNIGNYPLIPVLCGVIYNIYIIVKGYRGKNRVDA